MTAWLGLSSSASWSRGACGLARPARPLWAALRRLPPTASASWTLLARAACLRAACLRAACLRAACLRAATKCMVVSMVASTVASTPSSRQFSAPTTAAVAAPAALREVGVTCSAMACGRVSDGTSLGAHAMCRCLLQLATTGRIPWTWHELWAASGRHCRRRSAGGAQLDKFFHVRGPWVHPSAGTQLLSMRENSTASQPAALQPLRLQPRRLQPRRPAGQLVHQLRHHHRHLRRHRLGPPRGPRALAAERPGLP